LRVQSGLTVEILGWVDCAHSVQSGRIGRFE
jgi:hypothetical protein